jgi:hypothetical protein
MYSLYECMQYRCIKCGALDLSGKYELHQKMCTFHFLKWARAQKLTQHWTLDDEVIDNFKIGEHERGNENR